MHADATEPGGTIVPTLRYRDVAAAIDWLCQAFGFERQVVVSGEDGAVRYAELTFGTGMIMLGPAEGSAVDEHMTQPADTGGAETQVCYLFVADAKAHYARAKAAGAEIVLDIEDEASSGRGYSCRDPEGHVWNFGTYDPRKRSARQARPSPSPDNLWEGLRRLALAASLMVVAVLSAVVAGWALGITEVQSVLDPLGPARASVEPGTRTAAHAPDQQQAIERTIKEIREQLAKERGAKEAAERMARSGRDQLAQERAAREAAERTAKEAQAQLARERGTKEDAERAAREAGEQLAKATSERTLEEAREQLARERRALEAAQRIVEETRERLALAERSAEAVREQLTAERSARAAVERTSLQVQEQLAKERSAREAEQRAEREAEERAAKEEREQQARERAAAARRAPQRYRAVPHQPARPFVNWDISR